MPARAQPPIIALHVLVALWLSMGPPEIPEGPGGWLSTTVTGAPGCVDEENLQARAEALLGPDATPPSTRADIAVARHDGDRFAVQLRLEAAGEGTARTLSGRDCATLGEAIALVIAVHVDPLSVATNLAPRETDAPLVDDEARSIPPALAEPTPPARTTREAVPRDRPTPPARPRRPRGRPRVTLGAAAMAELGVLPRAAASLQLGVGLLWPRAFAEAAGVASVGPRASTSDAPGVTSTLRLYAGALRGCGVLGRGRVSAAMCGGLEAGDLRGRAEGLASTSTVNAPWIAATLGVRPHIVLHPRVALGAAVDLLVPLRRYRFIVGTRESEEVEVHTVAPIAARFGLSLQVRLN